ncbi:MAG: hypothetical protein M1825_000492 [Sarcosagium campestre]|nr:MAG: hypothetical protein M1825_000492 [Sarcosagium campestre]
MYTPSSPWTWAFIGISFVQAAIVLGFESYVFARFQTDLNQIRGDPIRTIPTYLTLFIFGFIYQMILVWDALRLKNTIQVIGLCLYNLGLLIYAAVQIDQIKDQITDRPDYSPKFWAATRPYLVAIPCIIALGTVLLSGVAWKLYDEFAWTIYKHISADLKMKRRYLTFQIYIALLKFDFFFFLGFTVQFVVIVKNVTKWEQGLTIAAIPITILILIMAAYFTRRESKPGMAVIIILYFAGLAYFSFKLGRMYTKSQVRRYGSARRSLTTFAVIALILIVITIINAAVCTYNFGRGLRPHITKRKVESELEKDVTTEMPQYGNGQGPMPSRMTID